MTTGSEPITVTLARFIAGAEVTGVPTAVRVRAGLILLDTIGVGLAGTDTPATVVARSLLEAVSTARGSRIAGLPGRAPAPQAALGMGLLIMATDFEPVGPEGHVCAAVVPALLSVLDAGPLTGAGALSALVAGLEVGGRIGAAMRRVRRPGDAPPVRGNSHAVFGAAAAAARGLGLTVEQTAHALAIAGYSAMPPTLTQAMSSPPVALIKYDNLPTAAQLGVQAALLARAGATGDLRLLDGPGGFWRFTGHQGYLPKQVPQGLGESWIIPETWYKRYPGSYSAAPAIDAALQLRDQHRLDATAITDVVVRLGRPATAVMGQTAPTSWGDVGLSLPCNLAMALLEIRPFRRWHSLETYRQPAVQQLVRATRLEILEEGTEGPPLHTGWSPAEVELQVGQQRYRARQDWLPQLEGPEILDKFRDNVSGILPASRAERVITSCLGLADLASAAKLLDVLVP